MRVYKLYLLNYLVTDEKHKIIQVSVEQCPSAPNMTLPAFAAERRRPQLSIDISYPQGAQQQTVAAVDERDRETNGPTVT